MGMRQEVLLAKLHDEARLHASQEWDKENGESQPASAPPAASKPKKKKTERPPDKAAKAPETTAKDAPAAANAQAEPADTARGATLFKAKCAACHTCNEGGPSKQGPNLYSKGSHPVQGEVRRVSHLQRGRAQQAGPQPLQ